MTRRYFGTDGVRGRVGTNPITPEFVMRLGNAAGQVLARHGINSKPTVLIGKDTRVSGYMLESALEAGLTAAGVNVMLAGPMPTPAIAYLTRTFHLSAGVVISASHNPFHDNGIKFFSAQGTKLPDSWELEIEDALDQPMVCVASESLGKVKRINDAAGRYIEFCKGTARPQLDLKGLKLVVDCANGAAYHIAGNVFRELGAEVVVIADAPDGFNINKGVGATHPETLQRAVLEHKADIGFALDGDADRLIVVDRTGRVYGGDELLYVMAMQRHAVAPVPGVVGTLMSNMALELAFESKGIGFVRAKVGDRYVFEQLKEHGWMLGGEGSGHLLCLDQHSTGDGIVSALQILLAMRSSGQDLPQLCAPLQLFPQVLNNIRVPAGYDWKQDRSLNACTELVQQELKGRGRVLIRPSGTEPLLRIMVEAPTLDLAQACADRLQAAMTV